MRLGRYQLISGIARGGMAEIFLARDTTLPADHRCIVKRLLPARAANPDMQAMFLDEGRITSLFRHPNVDGCTPPELVDDTWFLVMDYVEGTNLGRLVEYVQHLGFGLPLPLAVHVIGCVAAGLDHAHHVVDPNTAQPLNIVHRDVTPDNILVGVNGEVKIADFGIAKGRGRMTKTMHGEIKGKAGYMSPEQVNGELLDARSDLFSLGVVMHELPAGQSLFSGGADFIAMQRVVREHPPPPSQYNAKVDAQLDTICMKALNKEPRGRFSRGGEMSEALSAWLHRAGYVDPGAVFADWLWQLAARG